MINGAYLLNKSTGASIIVRPEFENGNISWEYPDSSHRGNYIYDRVFFDSAEIQEPQNYNGPVPNKIKLLKAQDAGSMELHLLTIKIFQDLFQTKFFNDNGQPLAFETNDQLQSYFVQSS